MPGARVAQNVNNGGEIGPEFWARTDTIKYQTSLARARNLILHAGGGASNRAGFEFSAFALDETRPVTFIEFESEGGDSYMLEFSHFQMRIFQHGALVLYPTGHALEGQVVIIVTPYAADHVGALDYDQANDVLTLVDADDSVYELRRLDHHIWIFAVQTFTAPTNVPTGVTVTATVGFNDATATDPYVQTFVYAVTAILDDGRETIISATDSAVNRFGWPKNFNTITWVAPVGVTVSRYAIYRQRNALWGLVGYATALTFKDDNIAPDWGTGPPTSRNPFAGDNNEPKTVAYFQQRRIFGGTESAPFVLHGTGSALLTSMSISAPQRADDAFEIPGAGKRRQEIVALVPLADLLIFTRSGEWILTQDQGKTVTFKSYPEVVSNWGAEKIKPIVVGDRVLWVQEGGAVIRDLAYSFENQGYGQSEDRSIFVEHYFRGRKIAGWCYEAETRVFWVACDDGALFSFTYLLEHDVWGWSMQETAGTVEAIKSVREGDETGVYIQARRFLNGEWRRTIERKRSRKFAIVNDAFFVDCGLSYDNPLSVTDIDLGGSITLTVIGHGLDEGAPIEVELPGLMNAAGETFNNVSGVVEYFAHVVSADQISLLDNDDVAVSDTGWILYDGEGTVRERVTELTGFDHLANMPIRGLGDGGVIDGLVVGSTGDVTLPYPTARFHGGLGYDAELQTLEFKKGQQTTEGLVQAVETVLLRVARSRGFDVGPSFDKLRPPQLRDGEDYGPTQLQDRDIELTMDPEWGESGRVCVRQSDPLPMTVVGVIPTLIYQGT